MPETPLDGDSRKLPTYNYTNPDAIEVWKLYVEAILDGDDLLSSLEPIVDLATFKASLPSEEQAATDQHDIVKAYNLHVDAIHSARRRAYNKIATLPGVPSMRTREFIESKNLNISRDASQLWAFLLRPTINTQATLDSLAGQVAQIRAAAFDTAGVVQLPFSPDPSREEITNWLELHWHAWWKT